LTKQSGYTPAQSWQAVSTNRPSSAVHFMGMHQSLGIQLAQLGKDASAAGAARRVSAQRKTVEVESVAAAGKEEAREVVKKLFRAEFIEKQHEDLNEDIDLRAMENGFVSALSRVYVCVLYKCPCIYPTLQPTDICHSSECTWASGG